MKKGFDTELGFEWQPTRLLKDAATAAAASSSPTVDWAMPVCDGGPDGGAHALTGDPSPEQLKELAQQLTDLNKAGANALKLIQIVESSMGKSEKQPSGEFDLMVKTLDQLKACALEGEDLSLPLGRAVKFQKLDAGFTSQAVMTLGNKATEVLGKLCASMRLMKAILPKQVMAS